MGAALSIFVILSVSVFIVRVAAVALRITGLSENSSRFQSLSAFTGTGFTTSEAEMVVNYPVRRQIVSLLMIIGNMGLVTVLATLVASIVRTDGEIGAVALQVAWLIGGLALLWFLMLNQTSDRIMCSFIRRILESVTFLGKRRYHRLTQVGDGYSICEHPVIPAMASKNRMSLASTLAELNLELLAIRSPGGALSVHIAEAKQVDNGDTLVIFGSDAGHDSFSNSMYESESAPHARNFNVGDMP